ncbi:hypothetical protein PICMEDRAFT_71154 [Pichia membranifaciens NRRL Y-2026]|uniref:Uncharacterized protein n=1 Tax=Pichia membranifaciens NRRL Y-2026 TaxID=763406 RepID=A0A1E3NLL7_9ASCO|nr:hypothetical protein PICMEDRAFT_71154 [Pichia membranifaciens NRRL Y-2026]ODQ47027.1 hypothetical protein PICMEDRAFT_71154 [Pichia membranifaciens NRRL Y-2026]
MVVVPVTYEDVQEFIVEQERIITKAIKNDLALQNLLRKNGIDVSEEELNKIVKKVNRQMKRKYSMGWFTRQSRFQVSQQIIQVERESNKAKMDKLGDVGNVLKLFGDEGGKETGVGGEGGEENSVLDEEIGKLIKELPDSNLLGTKDAELIGQYDDIRDRLSNVIRRRTKLEKSISRIRQVNERVYQILKSKGAHAAQDSDEDEIRKEIARMRHLLALS